MIGAKGDYILNIKINYQFKFKQILDQEQFWKGFTSILSMPVVLSLQWAT